MGLRNSTHLAIRWLQVAEWKLVQHWWHRDVFSIMGGSLPLVIKAARVRMMVSSLCRAWALWLIVWSVKLTSTFRSLLCRLLYELLLSTHLVIVVCVFIEVWLLINCLIYSHLLHLAMLILLDTIFTRFFLHLLLLLIRFKFLVTMLKYLLTVCCVKACSMPSLLVIARTKARCVDCAWVLSNRTLVRHHHHSLILRASIGLMYLLLLPVLRRVVALGRLISTMLASYLINLVLNTLW